MMQGMAQMHLPITTILITTYDHLIVNCDGKPNNISKLGGGGGNNPPKISTS
jgi:hypothetical protein